MELRYIVGIKVADWLTDRHVVYEETKQKG